MYVIGKLIVEDQSFSILSYELRFQQVKNMFGQPTGRVNGGLIEVTIEAHRDHIFHRWALTTEMMKDVEIIFSPVTRTSKSRKIQLFDVFCASIEVDYDSYTTSPMTYTLLLSPGIFKDGTAILKKPWHVTNLDVATSNAPVSHDPAVAPREERLPRVMKVYWFDPESEQEEIKGSLYGSKVGLQIEIENAEKGQAEIFIVKEDGTEFEKGKEKLSFKSAVDSDGIATLTTLELKKEWEDYKTAAIDKIIAKVSYKGSRKRSAALKLVPTKRAIAFFIGGAGDKESYYGVPASRIIEIQVREEFTKIKNKEKLRDYESYYLGYNEACGDKDIVNHVISKIPNKEHTAIYIIGHSLGGWNGAHLSQILSDKGYNVDLLITLDPVGAGSNAKLTSDVFWKTPSPKANYWIYISSSPNEYEQDDLVADLGGQWKPKAGMQIRDECSYHHREAGQMFFKQLKDTNISASDMLLHHITLFLSK